MFNQLLDEPVRDIQVALIFGQVAFFVRLVEQQPLNRLPAQRVLQALEHQVTVLAAVAVRTQRGQSARMRGVIRKVEAALQRQRRLAGIVQAHGGRAQKTGALAGVRRFRLELADPGQVRQRRRAG